MNFDNLTIKEAREIAAMFGNLSSGNNACKSLNQMIGKKCIVRTYSAGVWFGEIAEKAEEEVIIKNARRLWQWKSSSGISLSSVAIHGLNESGSKVVESVDEVWLKAIELIPCSDTAIKSIEGCKNVKAQ